MPEVWAGSLGEERAITTADGGTAVVATAVAASYIQFPAMSKAGNSKQGHLTFTPRNFASSAVVVQVQLNPWLTILKTTDNMATQPIDYSLEAQDASTSTVVDLSSLNTVANGDWVLVGAHTPFGGFFCDTYTTNTSGTITDTVSYWNGASWVDTEDADGTKTSTHLDKDGAVTWTPSTSWVPHTLGSIYYLPFDAYYKDVPMYWVRWEVDDTLDGTTTLYAITAVNRSSAMPEYLSGQIKEQKVKWGWGGYGCIHTLTNTGTANLIANLAIEGVF